MTLREQLIRDEGGFQSKPYLDSVGALTIGYGRNLRDVGISEAEAAFMLDNDLGAAAGDVDRAVPWARGLDEVRRAVLVNMRFNMGLGGLLGFRKMLDAAEAGDWQRAAAEMLDSRWARQVGDRAQRLARQMTTGEWA